MESVLDEFDSNGELVFKIDYEKEGYYNLIRGTGEFGSEVIKRSKSVRDLVSYVANKFEGDPQVEMSDTSEVVYALEVSDGKEVWLDVLDEDCE